MNPIVVGVLSNIITDMSIVFLYVMFVFARGLLVEHKGAGRAALEAAHLVQREIAAEEHLEEQDEQELQNVLESQGADEQVEEALTQA